jgi:hypothetical protein
MRYDPARRRHARTVRTAAREGGGRLRGPSFPTSPSQTPHPGRVAITPHTATQPVQGEVLVRWQSYRPQPHSAIFTRVDANVGLGPSPIFTLKRNAVHEHQLHRHSALAWACRNTGSRLATLLLAVPTTIALLTAIHN